MATLDDCPNEILDEIFSSIDSVRDMVALSQTTPRLREWWAESREKYAVPVMKKVIPENCWDLSLLCLKHCSTSNPSTQVQHEDAVSILAPLVSDRNKISPGDLTDEDLVAMHDIHMEAMTEPLALKNGNGQLHLAASILVPQSNGDLDGKLVVNYFAPLSYAIWIAKRLKPSYPEKPRCRYGFRADWFVELAYGVMLDLKPAGWWDGLSFHNKELEAKRSVARFIGAQAPSIDPEGSYGYL
ncbi:hypothetical protein NLU13_0319 [Sarocladium strictum]|uniref:F-box domain-containing protein n=1 Tax=Sarocladium strictum TaxID=5046 RepID=A0AA39GP51_SARSR|nr:hypothetical protein NLU13_0319 [Sarocladium strictum]